MMNKDMIRTNNELLVQVKVSPNPVFTMIVRVYNTMDLKIAENQYPVFKEDDKWVCPGNEVQLMAYFHDGYGESSKIKFVTVKLPDNQEVIIKGTEGEEVQPHLAMGETLTITFKEGFVDYVI